MVIIIDLPCCSLHLVGMHSQGPTKAIVSCNNVAHTMRITFYAGNSPLGALSLLPSLACYVISTNPIASQLHHLDFETHTRALFCSFMLLAHSTSFNIKLRQYGAPSMTLTLDMRLPHVALLLAALPTAFAAVVAACSLGCRGCNGSQTIVWECAHVEHGTRAMKGVRTCQEDGARRIGHGCTAYRDYNFSDPSAVAATEVDCQLGANKCDGTYGSVMICGAQGWKVIETCFKVGACHVGSAGNAYCDKEIECTPGESQCDAANYVSKICNDKGFWQTDRKCYKPGCCEIQEGKAVCKAECGVGQQPPAERSTLEATRDPLKRGNHCMVAGERYCDEPTLYPRVQ